MKEAMFYTQKKNNVVQCNLCPHNCTIVEDNKGLCKARINKKGKLFSIYYAKSISAVSDPIEKKPLYHFHPGTNVLSLGTPFCNLGCEYCQNFRSSQFGARTKTFSPQKILKICLKNDIPSVAFTYTEPTIWYEYVYDTAKLLREHNINAILVTNGFINQEPLKKLIPYINAVNIDLKSMKDEFYKKYCKGSLQPVLNTIKMIFDSGIHMELTNLVIPGYNDSKEEIEKLIDFVAEMDPKIPLHFSKYYPQFKFSTPPTSLDQLKKIHKQAKEKLVNVYLGNINTGNYSITECPNCNTKIIERHTYDIKILELSNSCCANCGSKIYGEFEETE